ncbi:MAG: DUF255 domain-containing protein [Phycisphaerales bacterium]|nr:MAG: DUF255 domain-containing protein [Phycisphaerales bacterium]
MHLKRTPTVIQGLLVVATAVWAMPPAARGQDHAPGDAAPPLYDTQADAAADIAAAAARAREDNKRVLLMFGFNECVWCHRLHDLFESDRDLKKTLLYEYELVMVDNGRRPDGTMNNLAVSEKYGHPAKTHGGYPALVVLDGGGKMLKTQGTGEFEVGPAHDPKKVLAFLNEWKAPPAVASAVMSGALQRARAEGKKVFAYSSAPWCGWCHKLADYLKRPEIAAVMNREYVAVKIDVDRMTGGKDAAEKYLGAADKGFPFIAILDANGARLADGNGAKGNIGFPVEDFEIEHFIQIVRKTAPKLTEEQIAVLRGGLGKPAMGAHGGPGR